MCLQCLSKNIDLSHTAPMRQADLCFSCWHSVGNYVKSARDNYSNECVKLKIVRELMGMNGGTRGSKMAVYYFIYMYSCFAYSRRLRFVTFCLLPFCLRSFGTHCKYITIPIFFIILLKDIFFYSILFSNRYYMLSENSHLQS